jgi:DNA-directed RNA polymerase subunit H (RpoH/RPB5)
MYFAKINKYKNKIEADSLFELRKKIEVVKAENNLRGQVVMIYRVGKNKTHFVGYR